MNTFPKESAKDTGENAAVVIGAKLQTRDGSLSVCLGGRRVGWVGEDRQRAKVIQRRRNKTDAASGSVSGRSGGRGVGSVTKGQKGSGSSSWNYS